MNKYIVMIVVSFSFPYSSIYGYGEYVYSDFDFITDYSSSYIDYKSKGISNRATESVFNISYNIKSSSADVSKLENSYLSSFSFLFPVSIGHFIKFGVSPYTNSNINYFDDTYSYISANPSLGLGPLAFNSNYESIGGISKAYLNYSTMVNDNFFIGIEYAHSFGNLEQNKKIFLYDIVYDEANDDVLINYSLNDSMIIKKIHTFDGSSAKIEAKFRSNKNEYTISALYDFPLSVETRIFYNPFLNSSNESLGIYEDLEQLESALDANQSNQYKYESGLKNLIFQFKKEHKDYKYLVLQLASLDNFNYSASTMNLPDRTTKSIYLGYESYNPNYRLSSFEYINYKIGFYFKSLDYSDHDYGLQFDYGLNYAENNNMFISFKYGYQTHNLLNIGTEKYYFISLNLESIENWFLKGDY
tara:strand:- start:906 stop:2153 length:1248 start_codon:yes stop_codon:yes gene_type:complete